MSSHKARGSPHCKTQGWCSPCRATQRRVWPTGMYCPFSKHQLRTIWASVVGTPCSADYANNFVCSKPWDICLDCPGGKLSQAACSPVELQPPAHTTVWSKSKTVLVSPHIQFLTLEMGLEEPSILSHVAHEIRTLLACKPHADFAQKHSKTACRQSRHINRLGSWVSCFLHSHIS